MDVTSVEVTHLKTTVGVLTKYNRSYVYYIHHSSFLYYRLLLYSFIIHYIQSEQKEEVAYGIITFYQKVLKSSL